MWQYQHMSSMKWIIFGTSWCARYIILRVTYMIWMNEHKQAIENHMTFGMILFDPVWCVPEQFIWHYLCNTRSSLWEFSNKDSLYFEKCFEPSFTINSIRKQLWENQFSTHLMIRTSFHTSPKNNQKHLPKNNHKDMLYKIAILHCGKIASPWSPF